VFELGIKDGKVCSETKLVEYDFLLIALSKLSAYLHNICPDQKIYKNPVSTLDQALPPADEILKEHEADVKNK
jgi:hypothetical protein